MRRDVGPEINVAEMLLFREVEDAQRMAGIGIATVDAVAIDRHIAEASFRHDKQFVHRALEAADLLADREGLRVEEKHFGAHLVDGNHPMVGFAHNFRLPCSFPAPPLARAAEKYDRGVS